MKHKTVETAKPVVSRYPMHWLIKDSEESVWLIRHKLETTSERPLTDHERIIGFLCEQLMAANASDQIQKESQKPQCPMCNPPDFQTAPYEMLCGYHPQCATYGTAGRDTI